MKVMSYLAPEPPLWGALDREGSWLLQHVLGWLPRGLKDSLPSWLTPFAGKSVRAAGWELSQGGGREDSVALHVGLSI